MAFLYVLWSVADDLTKVGYSKRPKKRLSDHNGNSSNPTSFQLWKLFRFETQEDARLVEKHALKILHNQNFGFRDKNELFKCTPSLAARAIEKAALEQSISFLKDFPKDFDHLDGMGLDFLDLPYFLLDVLSTSERRAYFSGAAAVIEILSRLNGITLSAEELAMVVRPSAGNYERNGREMWRELLDSLLIIVEDGSRRKLISQGRERIERWQTEAFNSYQEIENLENDQAA